MTDDADPTNSARIILCAKGESNCNPHSDTKLIINFLLKNVRNESKL